jgi:hypothetical protein
MTPDPVTLTILMGRLEARDRPEPGGLCPGLGVVGRGRDAVADGAGSGRGGRHAAGARARRRRAPTGRRYRSDAGPRSGGRQGAPGHAAAPSRRGAGRRALPQPAPLRSMRGAAPAEGPAAAAPDLAVRGGGGPRPPLRPVPVRRRLPAVDTPVAEIMPDRCTPEHERVGSVSTHAKPGGVRCTASSAYAASSMASALVARRR